MKLLVELDGQPVELKDAVWVAYRPCGCACSVMDADWGDGEVFASEDQAWREFYPLKKDRDRAIKQGYRLELVTFAHYRQHIDILATCDECKPKKQAGAA
ncbi:hypothetical protein ABZ208_13995 [Streptomyces sp. NPDC006208]|uniref:hypothetical protein n=1 Tax=Streptomyces sp. NPDC006208 TaxID=3156734 RepID=UPI0033AEB4C5